MQDAGFHQLESHKQIVSRTSEIQNAQFNQWASGIRYLVSGIWYQYIVSGIRYLKIQSTTASKIKLCGLGSVVCLVSSILYRSGVILFSCSLPSSYYISPAG